MNLHIVNDEKFIDGVNTQFEKYSQGKNIFVVLDSKKQLKHVSLINNVIVINPLGINSLRKILIIARKNNVKKVFTHFLTPFSAAISNKLRAVCGVKLYWIFYGADLYSILAKYNNYHCYPKVGN
jgi:hypothetical protein